VALQEDGALPEALAGHPRSLPGPTRRTCFDISDIGWVAIRAVVDSIHIEHTLVAGKSDCRTYVLA